MSSLNQVNIIGRLGQDPEVKYLSSGSAVANLTVATSEQWNDKQTGEKKEATEWHKIVVYGKLAEICGEYLRKGSLAFFSGSLKTRKWQDQSGQDRYSTEINANEMKMLGGKPEQGNSQVAQRGQQGSQPQGGYSRPSQQANQQPAQQQGGQSYDDDTPF